MLKHSLPHLLAQSMGKTNNIHTVCVQSWGLVVKGPSEKPGTGSPWESSHWCIEQLLTYHYVEGGKALDAVLLEQERGSNKVTHLSEK